MHWHLAFSCSLYTLGVVFSRSHSGSVAVRPLTPLILEARAPQAALPPGYLAPALGSSSPTTGRARRDDHSKLGVETGKVPDKGQGLPPLASLIMVGWCCWTLNDLGGLELAALYSVALRVEWLEKRQICQSWQFLGLGPVLI